MYSPPADTLATTLTTIKSPNYNAFVNDVAADLNLARPVVSGGTGATSVASAQTALSLDNKVVYASKSGNYTALATDNNAVHRYTAAATVTLTAAATLAANWHYTVIADGGAVTIDPNGSETVNGAATLTVPNGSSATIICDGSNFFTVLKPRTWEPIGTGSFAGAGASFSLTNLSAFKMIRVYGVIVPDSAAQIYFRTSTNNGSSYDSGATDYLYQTLVGSSASAGASQATLSAMTVTNNTCLGATFTSTLSNFNKAANGYCQSTVYTNLSGGVVSSESNAAQRSSSTARNALQIITGGGVGFTWDLTVEGVRG